ncbi:MAG: SDR family NAD(P)-dependent oxidoreductase [Promethearchaeota archaeon]
MHKKYFRGKNAVITGSASGIGKNFALSLAKLGTNLVISDINEERLEAVRKEIENIGVKVISLKCDVSKQSDVKRLAKVSFDEMQNIYFLFSNAGVAIGGPSEYITISQWKRIININIWGTIRVVMAFIPGMIEQGFGHIITTSSIAGSLGTGGLIPYSTTKFAISGFSEALYSEYKKKGIEVSIICPFPIKTNLIETVGISFPPELIEGMNPEEMNIGIEEAKKYYWNHFCEKKGLWTGFCGGFEVERSVARFIKKISKKKLYIFDRRYGRFFQFVRGWWPNLYKAILKILGNRHTGLLEKTYEKALNIAKNEQQNI